MQRIAISLRADERRNSETQRLSASKSLRFTARLPLLKNAVQIRSAPPRYKRRLVDSAPVPLVELFELLDHRTHDHSKSDGHGAHVERDEKDKGPQV
jgi:hypothetical protein